MATTGTGAKGLDKKPTDSCYFEAIDLFLDIENDDAKKQQNKITLYKKDESVDEIKQLYFLSNPKGKNIRIEAKRVVEGKCRNPNEHPNIIEDDGQACQPIANSGSNVVSLKYDEICLDPFLKAAIAAAPITALGVANPMIAPVTTVIAAQEAISTFSEKNWLNYVGLPILKGNEFYKEEKFNFISCTPSTNRMATIIVYPDIQFNFEVKSERTREETHSIVKVDNKNTNLRNIEKTDKREGSATLSVEYNSVKNEIISFHEEGAKNEPVIGTFLEFSRVIKKFSNIQDILRVALKAPITATFIEFTLNKPSLKFSLDWQYDTSDDHTEIGGLYKIAAGCSPLIGGSITLKILKAIIAGCSGGTLTPVIEFIEWVKGILEKTKTVEIDIFIDLVFSANLNVQGELEISTVASKNMEGAISAETEFTIELKAGATLKAKMAVVKVDAEASASAKIALSVKFELKTGEDSFEANAPVKLLPYEVKVVLKAQVQLYFIKYGPGREWIYKGKEMEIHNFIKKEQIKK